MAEMRAIKTVVLGMTAVMLIMLALVLWGLSRNSDEIEAGALRVQQNQAAAAITTATTSAPAWEKDLPLGKIISLASAGAYLAVQLETATGTQLYLIDPRDGHIQGRLNEKKSSP